MNYSVHREATGMLKGPSTMESGMQSKKLVMFILEKISLKTRSFLHILE